MSGMTGRKRSTFIEGTTMTLEEAKEFYFKYNLDPDTVEKFDYYLFADTCKNLDIIDNNALKLKEVYEKIIKIYKDNEFCECDHLWLHKVNQDKMMDALYDFFNANMSKL